MTFRRLEVSEHDHPVLPMGIGSATITSDSQAKRLARSPQGQLLHGRPYHPKRIAALRPIQANAYTNLRVKREDSPDCGPKFPWRNFHTPTERHSEV
ncbi:hypothetical protein PMIN01_10619 [Paraphaeosphaeria minitans]|uniref:Uncharacterized protein n=1 Tax=Paraphaeosphaeria minitans TaxID=565426 RepID=A0A9P6KM57_9PLEO|nr:hypothetical protein PMIN01_10619 [Paraphaeosphaeria minitans]